MRQLQAMCGEGLKMERLFKIMVCIKYVLLLVFFVVFCLSFYDASVNTRALVMSLYMLHLYVGHSIKGGS